jgi:2-amino-4-hydroxy-6-hydroxymethyldihydropteridine diphosphokinase
MPATAYIALGSNLGDRTANLNAAVERLRREPGVVVGAVSRYWETAPVGGPAGQAAYLNAAAAVETTLSPHELLQVLLRMENELGRVRVDRYGPRTIDLDIMLFGNQVLHEPGLTIPHPRLHERTFMLGPLAEIAPGSMHPVFRTTIAELLSRVGYQPLLGKRALVTGSSSGIGKAIALALAERGADVLVHAGKSRDQAEATAAVIRHRGRQAEVILADLRDGSACARLAASAWEQWQGVEIVVLNAGADIVTGANRRADYLERLDAVLDVDVISTVLLARDLGARMKTAGQGVLLTMGWDQAETGFEGETGELFCLSKSAVMGFTRSLAINLAPEVRVNCLAPGWVKTAWGQTAPPAWQERAVGEAPLGRWGTPEDVAKAACWLAGPEASFITGQIIRINGGAV